MKVKEFKFHRENEKVEKWNSSEGKGLSAVAVPRILRGPRGIRHVHPVELRCPKRIGHRSA